MSERVYVVSIGHKDFAFYNQKDAIAAWDAMSKGYDIEQDWKISKFYMDNRLRVSLKTMEVYPKEEVLAERKALDEMEDKQDTK